MPLRGLWIPHLMEGVRNGRRGLHPHAAHPTHAAHATRHAAATVGRCPPRRPLAWAELGAIDRDLASSIRAAVGVWNRIAQGYAGFDHERLHAEASSGVRDAKRFLTAIATAAGV